MPNVDRSLGSWFAEGPEHAPAGLLAVTLAATSRTSQRPAALASALGAPSAAERVGRRVDLRVAWLVVALALAALAALLILIGLPRPSLVVAPSPVATPAASGPSATLAASPAPATAPPLFSSEQLGFAVAWDPSDPWTEHLDTWNGHSLGNPEWVAEFEYAGCPASCGGNLSVSSSSPWYGVVVAWTTECHPLNSFDCAVQQSHGGRPVRIRGASLEELTARWAETFGPAETANRKVEGLDALIVEGKGVMGALFVRQGRTFAITVHATDGSSDADRLARLNRFLDNMRFPDPPAAEYRDNGLGFVVSSLDSGPWALQLASWGVGPGDGESVSFRFGRCTDDLCGEPYISVSHGPATTGAIVGRTEQGLLLRVRGASLAKLRQSWTALFGTSTFGETTIGGVPAVIASDGKAHLSALAVLHGEVISVSIRPAAFAHFLVAPLEERLRGFTEGVVYFPVP